VTFSHTQPGDGFRKSLCSPARLAYPPDQNFSRLLVNFRNVTRRKLFAQGLGALGLMLVGVTLWGTRLGERWTHASYDALFHFSSRHVTNRVVIVKLDNASYSALDQIRGQPWDRGLHAKFLNRLTEDGCPLVVWDVFFAAADDPLKDQAFAESLERRRGRTVLMTKLLEPEHPGSIAIQVAPIYAPFAASAAWGIGQVNTNRDGVVRQHWPYPAPQSVESLAWVTARLAGAALPEQPVEQWLRYYGEGAVESYSYHLALAKAPGFFSNAIVFIGSQPENSDPSKWEHDKFVVPGLPWNSEAVGGVEIQAITCLNLLNEDWLVRPAAAWEILGLMGAACLLSFIAFLRPIWAWTAIVLVALATLIGAVLLGHHNNIWFPWLIIAGGQVPCAVVLAINVRGKWRRPDLAVDGVALDGTEAKAPRPDAPDYTFVAPPFGEGGFGQVWLVKNAVGQWQALKAVYQSKFGRNTKPFNAEFHGIQQYKPISNQHLGLLTVDFVSTPKPAGYFYYVMELGDSRVAGWEAHPETYRPLDLAQACAGREKNRLPVADCVRIGMQLADALAFLHEQGLAHRDIKPTNIIFVKGQPKLADVGLVTEVRQAEDIRTFAGTVGFMPPLPEPPGTKQADIYALGMVLYVISTGRPPVYYPELKTTLVMEAIDAEFMALNSVILQACAPDLGERFSSARDIKAALEQLARRADPMRRG
jgi:CHASE2 domain-containing sensor protein